MHGSDSYITAAPDQIAYYENRGYAVCGPVQSCDGKQSVKMVRNAVFDDCAFLCAESGLNAYTASCLFDCEAVQTAKLTISVLGFAEFYLNGKRLREDRLLPAISNYEKRDLSGASYPIYDTMCQRIYYLEMDLSEHIVPGQNHLVIHVGAGWYGMYVHGAEKMPKWGDPAIAFQVELISESGEKHVIRSDSSVQYLPSYVRATDIYRTEILDGCMKRPAQLTVSDFAEAQYMRERKRPCAVFTKQTFAGDTFQYSLEPVLLYRDANRAVYDLTRDVSGFWVMRFQNGAKQGDRAFISIGERIDDQYQLMLRHTGGENRLQRDEIICGDGQTDLFHGVFTWRAGRYAVVEGPAELVRFEVWHSPVPLVSGFHCENDTLNRLYEVYLNTQSCNIHGMIPSDCPHRERLGYTGDGQLCSGAVMTIYDAREMYAKWIDDIADCQDIFSGHIQHTAPMMGGGGGPGGWGGAICIVPWNYYLHYGDRAVLEKNFARMRLYIQYMLSRCEDGVVVREEPDGWCLGDWCTPGNDIQIPPDFVNTYFLIKCMRIVRDAAEVLGEADAAAEMAEQIKETASDFDRHYLDPATGSYLNGIQGADAFAVDLGLGDERTLHAIVDKYEKLGRYDTGIFGTYILTGVLFKCGYARLAIRLLTNESEISFVNMFRGGATSLWENWDGCDSLNHPMFGAVCEYLFTEILGVKSFDEDPQIWPAVLPELGRTSGYVRTRAGIIRVEINYADDGQHVLTEVEAC